MFLMPKVFMVETGENNLDKTGSQLWRHSWVVKLQIYLTLLINYVVQHL